jgi:N-acetylmuramoyl-L-alanine amidase
MQKLFSPVILKKFVSPVLALVAVIILSFFASQGRLLPVSGLYSPSASAQAALSPPPSPSLSPSPSPAAAPTPTPSPTPEPPPVDFETADFKGADAPALEALLDGWGFRYYPPDGKWTGEDAYEFGLFQRWAGLPATSEADGETRRALLSAWLAYGAGCIPREKLPLEGRYIGVNAGHQAHADYKKEALSPEKGSPKKARVASGTRGCVTKVYEYQTNLIIALQVKDRLEAMGARVLMVRDTNDVRISNVERARMMNDARVDAYLQLHCNGNGNKKCSGMETLVPVERGWQKGSVLESSRKLAALVQAEEIKAAGAKDIGLIKRGDLSGFNWSKVPTCLIEMGYMTNPAEDRLLNSAAYQEKLVDGMVNALLLYFGNGDQ